MIKRYYQYEEISGIERKVAEMVPENAYREAVANARIKPKFTITDHVISVILPVISGKYNVTDDEDRVVRALENGAQLASSEIAKKSGFTKTKTLRLIEALKEKGYVKVTGNGRGTKYSL